MDPNDVMINRRIDPIRPLLTPRTLIEKLPRTSDQTATVLAGRRAASDVIAGRDDRLLVVVGPCSVHDPVAALEYARRLATLSERYREELVVVMRVYFEKPRTTLGWKGLINDPGMDDTYDVNHGLFVARDLLLQIVALGLPAGCEFLDLITPQYLADVVSWAAIGARTTQSQVHRQLASGLSMPVGFKNTTEGAVQPAVDATIAAAQGQVFPGITEEGEAAIFSTVGNPDSHVILRGGDHGPNYRSASVADAVSRLQRAGRRGAVVIDVSHGNSGKDYRRQPVVAAALAKRLASGERAVCGVMIESFLVDGRQEPTFGGADALRYGQSVTDGCIGWESTDAVLDGLAAGVHRRRGAAG